MQLEIDGIPCEFVPLKAFAAQYDLPASFGTAYFQPKDWHGLARLDDAGDALNMLRERTLAAVPAGVPASDWLHHLPALTHAFEAHLNAINGQVGLAPQEIAFAVGGFNDVCSAWAFALLRAQLTHSPPPAFEPVYAQWLQDSVQLSGSVYEYTHHGELWRVRLVLHAYGRVGLQVRTPQQTHYVVDKTLACPAEGFMARLLAQVAAQMRA